jgi:hypothetical protein
MVVYKGHKISRRRIDNPTNKNRWEVLVDDVSIGVCERPHQVLIWAVIYIRGG